MSTSSCGVIDSVGSSAGLDRADIFAAGGVRPCHDKVLAAKESGDVQRVGVAEGRGADFRVGEDLGDRERSGAGDGTGTGARPGRGDGNGERDRADGERTGAAGDADGRAKGRGVLA